VLLIAYTAKFVIATAFYSDWWTLGIVPLMSKRTVGIVDGGGRRTGAKT